MGLVIVINAYLAILEHGRKFYTKLWAINAMIRGTIASFIQISFPCLDRNAVYLTCFVLL